MSVEKQYVMKLSSSISRRPGLVPPGKPTIEAAADGAVGDIDDVPGRSQHHALAAGVAAAPLGDDAGDGPDIGLNFRHAAIWSNFVDDDLLGPFAGDFGGIFAQQLMLRFFGVDWASESSGSVLLVFA